MPQDAQAEMAAEPRLYLDQDMGQPELWPIAGGEAVVFSARCPEKSTANEDAAVLIPIDDKAAVLAVADGLGGGPAGERAAGLALEILRTSIQESVRDGILLRSAIIDALERANREVRALGVGAATTMAVVEVCDGTVRPYHVGDSMILLVGSRGRVKLQTIAHSPIGYAVEAGVVDEADAMHHEERHIISNYLGSDEMRIELGPSPSLAERDTILLATDGLFDNLRNEEIVERIRCGNLLESVTKLVGDARGRMTASESGQPSKPDDLTLIAFRGRRRPRERG